MRGKHTLAEFWLTWEDGSDPFPGLDFSSLLSNLSSAFSVYPFKVVNTKYCESCKTSIEEIANTGKLGCENCYKTFYSELLPFIKKVQRNVKHIGKRPVKIKNKMDISYKKDMITSLKERLKIAIEKQEFEKAAVLRDQINELTNKGENL